MKLSKKWALNSAGGSETAELIDALKEGYVISDEVLMSTYGATAELIANSFEHAYPAQVPEAACEIHLSVAADESLHISVVDSGITIPQSIIDKIVSSAKNEISLHQEPDSTLIRAAIDGGTNPNKPWRGKGLSSILQTTQSGLFATFSITSRHGFFCHSSSGEVVSDKEAIFEGTSVSFSIIAPSRESKRTRNREISIVRDFSRTPAGRYLTDGPKSGEAFSMILENALNEADIVTVDLDGALGFGSSFLEEAFGGLVRRGLSSNELKSRLNIICKMNIYTSRIMKYIDDAENTHG